MSTSNLDHFSHSQERTRLDEIAKDSWYAKGVHALSVKHCGSIFLRYLKQRGATLELGPAEGLMTRILSQVSAELTLVEGSETFAAALRTLFPNATVITSLFEDYTPNGSYDNIILGHVLEHVSEPVKILKNVRSWLSPGGRVLAAVPNARSIHRQAAVQLGMLREEHSLNDTDVHHGHRRVYDPESFRFDFREAGLKIEAFGGYWIKPLSNRQIEESWSEATIVAFMELGERYPDIAAEIYVVASA